MDKVALQSAIKSLKSAKQYADIANRRLFAVFIQHLIEAAEASITPDENEWRAYFAGIDLCDRGEQCC
jgi:soluble cytochrome b562